MQRCVQIGPGGVTRLPAWVWMAPLGTLIATLEKLVAPSGILVAVVKRVVVLGYYSQHSLVPT